VYSFVVCVSNERMIVPGRTGVSAGREACDEIKRPIIFGRYGQSADDQFALLRLRCLKRDRRRRNRRNREPRPKDNKLIASDRVNLVLSALGCPRLVLE
jgi:hypothetical protein